MDILEINEHMVHRGRKMRGGRHKSLQDSLEEFGGGGVEEVRSRALREHAVSAQQFAEKQLHKFLVARMG